METVYTLEELSEHLKVPVEAIEREIQSGRLEALNIGGHLRISEFALAEFKKAAVTNVVGKRNETKPISAAAAQWLKLQGAANFVHRWPDGKVEEYRDVQEGIATDAGRQYHVKLGWTKRKTGGEERQRWLVLVDRYPTVEFVRCTELGPNKVEYAASIIRDRKNKQVPALATLPAEYKEFSTAVYSDKVRGSGSSNGQAVVCPAKDFQAMVRHALIRTKYREERK